ncbi:MAG: PepSY domain-containing protein, partial [Alloprevotella tannerae]|nr:PepSY domain-containing protein [Alloprevotella tannerae]
MKKKTWRKHHKWLGLILGFFIIMFSLSGLILNHPMLFADVNISRKMLPEVYQYKQWNNGLLRGSLKWGGQVLIYGNNGIWLSDTNAVSLKDFNRGLPQGVDYRQIRRVDQTSSGQLFAAGQYGLYT